jgi:TolA-binding protein
MSRSSIQSLGLLLVCTLTSGCLMTRSQIQEKNEKQILQSQLQETKAQASVQYADMEEQVRETRGRLEVLENQLRMSRAAEAETRSRDADEKRKLEDRLKLYEEAISKLEKDIQTLNQAIEAQAKAAAQSTPRAEANGKKLTTFERADALFEEKKWREAIVEFQKYRDNNPKGKNYSDATYKIGAAFQELGFKDEAKAFFNEVVGKFPKSKSADKAKVRLKQLK